jgi:hypothetical protein
MLKTRINTAMTAALLAWSQRFSDPRGRWARFPRVR